MSSEKFISFATSRSYAGLTEDERLVARELKSLGVVVSPLIWDEPNPDGPVPDAMILRSCWDYHYKTETFVDWLKRFQSGNVPLWNPPEVALWNLNKDYLTELSALDIGIPKTLWLEAGSSVGLKPLLETHGLDEVVIKPAISMSGMDTWRSSLRNAEQDQGALNDLLHNRKVMVQEFIPEILSEGEISLIFIGGSFSHAVRKRPASGEFRIHEEYGGRREVFEVSAQQLAMADRVLSRWKDPLLYARVDFIPSLRGPLLIEVELIDPFLFLTYSPQAVNRFARAITEFLGR